MQSEQSKANNQATNANQSTTAEPAETKPKTEAINNSKAKLSLKICEGCGRLWFRPDAQPKPYCPPCSQRFARMPIRTNRQLAKGKRKPSRRSAAAPTPRSTGGAA